MPLPVAHSIMGYALSEAMPIRLAKKRWVNVAAFVTLANLPDIDYLPGLLMNEANRFHHHEVHSISFALTVGLLGGFIYWLVFRKGADWVVRREEDGFRFWPYFLAISGVVLSHCVLDLLTADYSPPKGMMLLWPLDENFYDMSWNVFMSAHKSETFTGFFPSLLEWYNFKVALREFLIMAPIAGLIKLIRRLPGLANRPRAVNIQNTQVAKLGLLEVSPLPTELANRRSLTGLVEAEELDETNE